MLLAGDEFARTQGGNNNAYCQDNEISWVDWTLAEKHAAQVRFVQSLTVLRRRYPILRRNRFLSTVVNEAIGVKEVTWIHVSGAEMRDEDWLDTSTPCFGMLLDGRAQVTGIKQRGQDATMLLIVNSHHDAVPFTLPAAGDDLAHARWSLLLDTQFSMPAHTADNEYGAGDVYSVAARSLLLLKLKLPPEAPLWSEQR
jgi:glycogen operon protein